MIELAEQNGAPLLSCSHVRMLPQAELFKRRMVEIKVLRRATVIGHGPEPGPMADSLAIALCLFGDSVHSVESMGAWPMEILHLYYEDELAGHAWDVLVTNTAFRADRSALFAYANGWDEIYFDGGANDFFGGANDFTYPEGGYAVMQAIKRMVASGKPPIPYDRMLAPLRVAEAARAAHNTGQWVPIHNPS